MSANFLLIPIAVLLVSLPGFLASPLFAKGVIKKGMKESLWVLTKLNLSSNTIVVVLNYLAILLVSREDAGAIALGLYCGIPAFLLDTLLLPRLLNSTCSKSQIFWNVAWRVLSSLPLVAIGIMSEGSRAIFGD